jgi:flagellar basal body P-ring formation protein FlgA
MSTTTARYAGVLARASLLPLSMLLPLAAAAQAAAGQGMPDGMIMIPGNGEPGAVAPRAGVPGIQQQGMRLGTATPAPARAADADATFENAARNAQIVIPGNGEPGAPGMAPSQVNKQANNQAGNQTPRLVQNNRSNVNAVTIDPTTDRRSTQLADSPSTSSLAPAADTATLDTRAAATSATEAAEPHLHPAVAALLAQRNTEPAAPRSALVQLQKQAATELGRDAATHGTATEAPRGTAGQAAPGHTLSLANAPTARSMPALDTIPAGQILGAVRPPGSRVQSVIVNTPARSLNVAAEGNDTRSAPGTQAQTGTPSESAAESTPGAGTVQRVALRVPGNDPATGARDATQAAGVAGDAPRAQLKVPKEIVVNVVTTVPANTPPIAHSVVVVAAPAAVAAAATAPVLPGKQDPAVIMKTAEDFLRQQATGLPGRVTLSVPPIAPRGLAACDNLQAFMAPGAPMWGRTTVGVRCTGEKPWTIYLLARVSVQATYYVAGRSISPGDVIQMADLVPREGDLTVMPRAIVTDPSQVVGAVAENRISAGLPLRSDLIRSPQAIQLGQTVKVVAQGDGFSISTDGNAMNNASPGQQVRVKTSGGQTVVGTASGKGVVQIPM